MQKKQPSLLILAAGMGSRYGGLKQLDAFGPNGETIIDYSIYDALLAGFKKITFVIRKSFKDDFINQIGARWQAKADLHYVFQEMDMLPEPFTVPESRTKPWGTGHAVWVAKDAIQEAFGVINADDYYGREALRELFTFLNESKPESYAVVAYALRNTLSENGAVNRGICKVINNKLMRVDECKGIETSPDIGIYYSEQGQIHQLDPQTPVSMNMWGFQSNYFDFAYDFFNEFLKKRIHEKNAEFYIPELIQELIDSQKISVDVIESPSTWFGVTYKEDKEHVQQSFNKMILNGYYPSIIHN